MKRMRVEIGTLCDRAAVRLFLGRRAATVRPSCDTGPCDCEHTIQRVIVS